MSHRPTSVPARPFRPQLVPHPRPTLPFVHVPATTFPGWGPKLG
jgi:hypothetical protein